MDKLAVAAVDVAVAGVPVGKAGPDSLNQVALQEELVSVALAGLNADHTCVQEMVLRDGSLAPQRRRHGNLQILGKRYELVGGVGKDDPPSWQQHGPLGIHDHLDHPADGLHVWSWLLH